MTRGRYQAMYEAGRDRLFADAAWEESDEDEPALYPALDFGEARYIYLSGTDRYDRVRREMEFNEPCCCLECVRTGECGEDCERIRRMRERNLVWGHCDRITSVWTAGFVQNNDARCDACAAGRCVGPEPPRRPAPGMTYRPIEQPAKKRRDDAPKRTEDPTSPGGTASKHKFTNEKFKTSEHNSGAAVAFDECKHDSGAVAASDECEHKSGAAFDACRLEFKIDEFNIKKFIIEKDKFIVSTQELMGSTGAVHEHKIDDVHEDKDGNDIDFISTLAAASKTTVKTFDIDFVTIQEGEVKKCQCEDSLGRAGITNPNKHESFASEGGTTPRDGDRPTTSRAAWKKWWNLGPTSLTESGVTGTMVQGSLGPTSLMRAV